MKKIKMFAAVSATVIGLAMIPNANALTAKADEPVTYYVTYNEEEGDWFSQASTTEYDEGDLGMPLDDLRHNLKNGDVVVVFNTSENASYLDMGNVHLSNLTIYNNSSWAMIKAGSIDSFFANDGSSSSITGTITNAYVYFNAVCSFHSNINVLSLYYDENDMDNAPNIGSSQKVGQVNFCSPYESDGIYYSIYNVTALSIENGELLTEDYNYSREPVAASAGTTSTNTATTGSSSSNSSEYDEVPKTGQNNVYLWLLGIAAACFVGSGMLRKASH